MDRSMLNPNMLICWARERGMLGWHSLPSAADLSLIVTAYCEEQERVESLPRLAANLVQMLQGRGAGAVAS